MSKKSKSGIEDALGIPSADLLKQALQNINANQVAEDDDDLDAGTDVICDESGHEMSKEEIEEALEAAKELRHQLRQIPDILNKEKEIDIIANDAAKYFEDIMDKAFNTEDRFAPELFNSANALLKTALDGKNSIINAKLKLLDLELKKRKLEIDAGKIKPQPGQMQDVNNPNGGNVFTDRNSLLD